MLAFRLKVQEDQVTSDNIQNNLNSREAKETRQETLEEAKMAVSGFQIKIKTISIEQGTEISQATEAICTIKLNHRQVLDELNPKTIQLTMSLITLHRTPEESHKITKTK